jgi:simple sugar transport system substrate-binding protein
MRRLEKHNAATEKLRGSIPRDAREERHRKGRIEVVKRLAQTVALLGLGLATTLLQQPAVDAQDAEKLKIVYVSHDPLTDPWMIPVATGLEQAAKDLNVEVIFRSVQNLAAAANEQHRLIEDAIALKPDGLIVANWNPVGLNPAIKSAVDQGIPVVITVAGFGEVEATGALTYIGNNEETLGLIGGQQLAKAGSKHALIMTTLPGLKVADERAIGFAKGFAPGKVTELKVPFEVLVNTTGLVNAAMANLQKDETIDGVFSIGACCTAAFVAIIDQLGDRAKSMHFGTIDLGAPALKAIVDGKADFALDGQQYLQGYLSVLTLANYLRYDFQPAEKFIATGPAVVDKSNAQEILDLTDAKVR